MPPAISPTEHIALSRRYGCDKVLDYHSKTLGYHGEFLATIAITKKNIQDCGIVSTHVAQLKSRPLEYSLLSTQHTIHTNILSTYTIYFYKKIKSP